MIICEYVLRQSVFEIFSYETQVKNNCWHTCIHLQATSLFRKHKKQKHKSFWNSRLMILCEKVWKSDSLHGFCFAELWWRWNFLYSPFIFCETLFFLISKRYMWKKRIVCMAFTNIKTRRCEKHMTKKSRKSREINTSLYRYSIQGFNSTNKHNSQLCILKIQELCSQPINTSKNCPAQYTKPPSSPRNFV